MYLSTSTFHIKILTHPYPGTAAFQLLYLLWILFIHCLCRAFQFGRWWQQCKPALDSAVPVFRDHMVGFGWCHGRPGQIGGLAALSCTVWYAIPKLVCCKHGGIGNRVISSNCCWFRAKKGFFTSEDT